MIFSAWRRAASAFFRLGKMLSGCLWPLGLALVVGIALALCGRPLEAAAVLLGGVPLGIASSIVGENVRHAGAAGRPAEVAGRSGHDDPAARDAGRQRARRRADHVRRVDFRSRAWRRVSPPATSS